MPVYQYACTECGEQLEVRQSFTDDALTVCPACEGRLRKVLSAVGVVFKGSGFYRNDSRTTSSESSEGTSTKTPEKAAASSESAPSTASPSKSDSNGSNGSNGSKSSSNGTSSSTPAAAVSGVPAK